MAKYENTTEASEWVNTSNDSVEVSFWSGDKKLKCSVRKAIICTTGKKDHTIYLLIPLSYVGAFKSELSLWRSTGVVVHEFEIIGRVLAPVQDVFKTYRNEFWPFRSKSQVINFKSGFIGSDLNASIYLYNFGGSNLNLDSASVSDYYEVEFSPKQVPHDSFTRMDIRLKTDSILPPGFIREVIKVKDRNDSVVFSIPVQFTLENRPQSLEGSAPNIAVSIRDYDFKVIEAGSKQSTSVKITNVGGQPLELAKDRK